MTPLERAARALYERDGSIYQIVPPGPLLPWGELTPDSKRPWLHEARTAITAIREPSEAMAKAGQKAAVVALSRDGGYRMEDTWQAMIDALLAEEG